MRKYRRFLWVAPALVLVLVFAGNALAGPNADAVVTLDIQLASGDGNTEDDGVTSVTIAGNGTEFDVEIFVSGVTTDLQGLSISFDTLDASGGDVISEVVEATGDDKGDWEFSIPTTRGTNFAGAGAFTVPTNGYVGTVTFTTQVDVTDVEFSLKVSEFLLTPVSGVADTDTLTVATVLLFNSAPKVTVPAEAAGGVEVPAGGASDLIRVTAAGFAAGATLTWHVEVTGTGATVDVFDDQNAMMPGGMFPSTSTFIDIKATDAGGDVSVEVWANDEAGVESDRVTLLFSRQLPVELASFGGELIDDSVILNWTTASQTNNAGWRVLRSVDGLTYEQVGKFVLGAGTSDALQNYSFVDNELPSSQKTFYVLEQIDLDGTVHRSNRIEMLMMGARFLPAPTEFAVNAYPNPFNPSTTLAYDIPSDAIVNIVIYDALGQEVRRLVATQRNAGRYTVQWDARDNLGHGVGSGVYIAKIEAGAFSASQKMLLLK